MITDNSMDNSILSLLKKYDVPTPRYTSYPTVPYWDFSSIDQKKWERSVINTFNSENGELCIYIHLPFCENLCTFCACNKRITKNHGVEDPYISTVLKEWQIYRSFLPSLPVIKEIHLGGGTPTFFSPDNLVRLINGITANAIVSDDHEYSIEVHPNYTTEEHLKRFSEIGFNRISIGVQDFDPVIQFAINRVQSFETTNEVVGCARKYNYTSINVDLIYGLPHQTIHSVLHTINLIKKLMPDRIAFYSYAHVPWKSKAQRHYTEADLPSASEKWDIYSTGKSMLEDAGYKSIGMDHFAMPNDKLFIAEENGDLHRNFMGYTTTKSKLIIALGMSAISATQNAFVQNEKVVEEYEDKINRGILPLENGHLLDEEDMIIQNNIHELMCLNKTTLNITAHCPDFLLSAFSKLKTLEEDGLVIIDENTIHVTTKGKLFIRNICAAIDAQLYKKHISTQTFSKAI